MVMEPDVPVVMDADHVDAAIPANTVSGAETGGRSLAESDAELRVDAAGTPPIPIRGRGRDGEGCACAELARHLEGLLEVVQFLREREEAAVRYAARLEAERDGLVKVALADGRP